MAPAIATVENQNLTSGKRPPHRFVKGNPGGPGRPKGSYKIDLLRQVARESESGGRNPKKEVAKLWWSLLDRGLNGDTKAADIALKYVCVPAEKRPDVSLTINQNSVSIGDRLPDGASLGEYFVRLQEAAIKHGILSIAEPVRINTADGPEPCAST